MVKSDWSEGVQYFQIFIFTFSSGCDMNNGVISVHLFLYVTVPIITDHTQGLV